jgi:hypothetical protein
MLLGSLRHEFIREEHGPSLRAADTVHEQPVVVLIDTQGSLGDSPEEPIGRQLQFAL